MTTTVSPQSPGPDPQPVIPTLRGAGVGQARDPQPPTKGEFAENEILVEVENDGKPDSLNRVHFTAFWLDDYLPPDGVRAQHFHGDLDRYIEQRQRRGYVVRRRWSTTTAVAR